MRVVLNREHSDTSGKLSSTCQKGASCGTEFCDGKSKFGRAIRNGLRRMLLLHVGCSPGSQGELTMHLARCAVTGTVMDPMDRPFPVP